MSSNAFKAFWITLSWPKPFVLEPGSREHTKGAELEKEFQTYPDRAKQKLPFQKDESQYGGIPEEEMWGEQP